MRFSILALVTFIGLALATPIEAGKDSAASVQVNNCYTLCKIDGGVCSSRFHDFDCYLMIAITEHQVSLLVIG
ncbi:hypothetical protein N7517_008326 [Penicillium concentricum]|uniref:Apple domain-containing protein n=1 Tax=Penicillium concentricum TaxID=293559 RepID=A0A9W9V3R9_9EURO|nr:uncharacterized protein N7517_008326 [Penicillium concentricum]KAJ5365440.1 hypothetical protein N7517_008326 [Penicillium concentricum]